VGFGRLSFITRRRIAVASASILSTLGLAVLVTALVGAPDDGQAQSPVSVNASLPRTRTPVDRLAPSGFSHHEVLRIKQEGFHSKPGFEIVLDGWIQRAKPSEIAELRLWWLDTNKHDDRAPFGRGVTAHIDIEYEVQSATAWSVAIVRGKKQWVFDVEADANGNLHAFGDIVEAGGKRIDHCRANASRLVPSRFLGVLSGIDRVEVDCVDDQGKRHEGQLAVRKHRRRRG
jgi:hypothetical protein